MRSTRRSNRRSTRRRSTRRQRGGANASAPKPTNPFFNAYGVRHHNVEINTAFTKERQEQIQKELSALTNKHYVSESESNNTSHPVA